MKNNLKAPTPASTHPEIDQQLLDIMKYSLKKVSKHRKQKNAAYFVNKNARKRMRAKMARKNRQINYLMN